MGEYLMSPKLELQKYAHKKLIWLLGKFLFIFLHIYIIYRLKNL